MYKGREKKRKKEKKKDKITRYDKLPLQIKYIFIYMWKERESERESKPDGGRSHPK